MERQPFATKDEFWRLQDTLTELSTTQTQHTDKIMRLEKRLDDSGRPRNVWTPASPFPSVLGSSQHGVSLRFARDPSSNLPSESGLNPAAEAFRNFDTEPGISSLSLDNGEDSRRAAASRANSVRFDESANNHYGSSRQSIDLPTRTGSGLGGHPMSERSLSHRSDGRGNTAYFGRTNSFGLEQSRLLGSIHNSPRVSSNPPPGFFVLGSCPSIIRCWLTETFTNDSLLYAAICTGSACSTVSMPLLQRLGLNDQIVDESGLRKIKLPVYLTEARIQHASSRSASPVPQVPTLIAKFNVIETGAEDRSISIVIGSDILRSHSADIMMSQDKLLIFDEERNQLSIPLVRPENEDVYKNLSTGPKTRTASMDLATMRQSTTTTSGEAAKLGVIGRPSRIDTMQPPDSLALQSPTATTSAIRPDAPESTRTDTAELTPRSSAEIAQPRPTDDTKSTTGSDKSTTTPLSKSSSGVWGNSWRSTSVSGEVPKPTSSYSKPVTSRPMKVLRPTKSTTGTSRTVSAATPSSSGPETNVVRAEEAERRASIEDGKSTSSVPSRNNPIGSGSAFGWLNSGQQKRGTANGS